MEEGFGLSLIYPVLNEEAIVEENLEKTFAHLQSARIPFEVLAVNNGSTDKTVEKLKVISEKYSNLVIIDLPTRGLGLAIKEGIAKAKYSYCMFYAIDLPFGLDVVKESLDFAINNNADIVIGSKGHPKSNNNAPLKRKISSFIFNSLLKLLFGLKINDTQGSLLFGKEKIKKLIDHCKSNDAFFCTQVILYGNLFKLNIKEIPVNYDAPRKNSKIKILKDGSSLLKQVINERREIKNVGVRLCAKDDYGKGYPKINEVGHEKLNILWWCLVFFTLINFAIWAGFSDELVGPSYSRLSFNASANEIGGIINKIKKDKNKKIIFIGGSVLWGSTTQNQDQTIPAFISKKFDGKVSVYNLALNAARPLDMFLISYLLRDVKDAVLIVDINYAFYDQSAGGKDFIRVNSLLKENYLNIEQDAPGILSCLKKNDQLEKFKPSLENKIELFLNKKIPLLHQKDRINLLLFNKHPSLIVQGLFNLVSVANGGTDKMESFKNIFRPMEGQVTEKSLKFDEQKIYHEGSIDEGQVNFCISKAFYGYIKDNKLPVYFYLLPQNNSILGDFADSEIYSKNNAKILSIFRGDIKDFHDALRESDFDDIYHLNESGNQKFSDVIYDNYYKLINK